MNCGNCKYWKSVDGMEGLCEKSNQRISQTKNHIKGIVIRPKNEYPFPLINYPVIDWMTIQLVMTEKTEIFFGRDFGCINFKKAK